MTTDHDTTRIVRSWLRTDEHESGDRILANALALLDATPQRRPYWPSRRSADMNALTKSLIAVAAVVAIAVIGVTILPKEFGPGLVAPTPTPTPTPIPSTGDIWPRGLLDVGHHEVRLGDVEFSFDTETPGWNSYRYTGMLEQGAYPTSNYRWVGFGGAADGVAAEACSGKTRPIVGTSIDDLATAFTTIPGTAATGPTDTTVGGHPARLVAITIRPDVDCAARELFLDSNGAYPNTLDSVIKQWFVDVDGSPFVIHADQSAPDPTIEAEIQQIVDSVRFP